MLTTHALLAMLCSSSFLMVSLAAYSLAVAPSAAGSRLGIRGFKRGRALRARPLFRAVEPFLRWLAARVSPLVKGRLRGKLERQIVMAGDLWGLSPDEYMALNLVACATGFVTAALFKVALHKPILWVMLLGPFGGALPYFILSTAARRRCRRIQNSLPNAVDLVSLALSAGLDFPGALRQIVDKTTDPNDPLTEEIGYILQELQIGRTRRQALNDFRLRVPIESVREFVGAVLQAEDRGNPLADVLQIQATASRQRRSVRAEELAAKAGIKILVPCLLVFGAVVLLIAAPLFLKIRPLLSD